MALRAEWMSSRYSSCSQSQDRRLRPRPPPNPLGQLPPEAAIDAAQVIVAPGRIPLPEGHARQVARRRGDDDPVVGDLLHAPGAGPQRKHVAGTGLKDKLFVQLAQLGLAVGQVGGKGTPVGDGAAVADGQQAAAGQGGQPVVDPVPGDARPQLAESGAGIAADSMSSTERYSSGVSLW